MGMGGRPTGMGLLLARPSLLYYPPLFQDDSLGSEHKHWRRAKFFQQYRLFFRFHQDSRVIVLAWVNDETTKRAYGAKSDPYRVFRDMLIRGCPPNDWDTLVCCRGKGALKLVGHSTSSVRQGRTDVLG